MESSEVDDEVTGLHGQLEAQLLQKLDEQVRFAAWATHLLCGI